MKKKAYLEYHSRIPSSPGPQYPSLLSINNFPKKLPVNALDPPITNPIKPVTPTKIVPLEKPIMAENLSGRSDPEEDQMTSGTNVQTMATPNAPAIKAVKADPLNQAEIPPIKIINTQYGMIAPKI